MAEFHTLKLRGGGPRDGTYLPPVSQYGWPLPARITQPGGEYVKVAESSFSDDDHPNISRGAEYRWQPGGTN